MLPVGVAAGQQAATKPAAVAGVSRERLQRLDALLQEHVDQNRIAGRRRPGAAGWQADLRTGARVERQGSEPPHARRFDLPHRLADQGAHERGDPRAHGRRAPHAGHAREPVHSRVREDDGGGQGRRRRRQRCRRDGRSRSPICSRTRPASRTAPTAWSRPTTRPRDWARRPGSDGTRPTRTKTPASRWSGWRRCRSSRSQANPYVYGYNTDILGCVVERASRHAARPVRRGADHQAARDEGHAVLPARRRARPSRDGLCERAGWHDRSRAGRRPRSGTLCRRAAKELRRRRRVTLHRARLRQLSRDDAQRRGARRCRSRRRCCRQRPSHCAPRRHCG